MSIPVSTLTGSNTINQMMYNVNTIKNLAANSAGFVANTVFQSALANTNSYIASVASSTFTGPGSSTDNAVVRFDGTSGGLTQDSSVLIADNGTLSATQSVNSSVTFLTQTNNGTAGGSGLKITAQSGTYVGKFDIAAAGALAQIGSETNHPLIILTNNTERMRIDSSGNVGIGTTSPDGKLHVFSASAGSVTAPGDGDELVVEGNFNTGISILSPDLNNTGVYFGSASDNLGAQILWNRTTNRLLIGTDNAGAEIHFHVGTNARVATLDASGNLGIGRIPTTNKLEVAGTIESTSGGFKFPDGSTQTKSAGHGLSAMIALGMA